jgi:type IV pilus assembly protein PilO
MNLSEIDLDFNAAGSWPLAVKAVVLAIVCSIVIAIGVYVDTMGQLDLLDVTTQKEPTLKTEFETKQKKAVNLEDYQEQLAQIEATLEELIRQLPTEDELASLLIDISQTGLASGLKFTLFKPEAPVLKDFYSELPINIQVIGNYEQLGLFVSGVSSLPRIVTMHNITILPQDIKNKDSSLLMNALVRTYNEAPGYNVPATNPNKKRVQK